MEHKGDGNTSDTDDISAVTKGLVQGLEDLENKKVSGDHPNNNIVEIGQNTKKNPGDLTRLAVTQILVENHQPKLV